jgi:hypothetical protein
MLGWLEIEIYNTNPNKLNFKAVGNWSFHVGKVK